MEKLVFVIHETWLRQKNLINGFHL